MASFNLSVYDGKVYLKEEIKEILEVEEQGTIRGIANAKTVVLFPMNCNLKRVKESLEILLKDIELREKLEEEKEND